MKWELLGVMLLFAAFFMLPGIIAIFVDFKKNYLKQDKNIRIFTYMLVGYNLTSILNLLYSTYVRPAIIDVANIGGMMPLPTKVFSSAMFIPIILITLMVVIYLSLVERIYFESKKWLTVVVFTIIILGILFQIVSLSGLSLLGYNVWVKMVALHNKNIHFDVLKHLFNPIVLIIGVLLNTILMIFLSRYINSNKKLWWYSVILTNVGFILCCVNFWNMAFFLM
jgi:hypothetical protein